MDLIWIGFLVALGCVLLLVLMVLLGGKRS